MQTSPPPAVSPLGQVLGAHLHELPVAERTALARRRFFDDGERPTGLVSEEVIQSWARCQAARLRPGERLSFNPVTRSRLHSVETRHRRLLDLARDDLSQLAHTLSGTPVVALLLDAEGVVMHVSARGSLSHERLLPLAARVGVCLSEAHIGTNAPAMAALHGRACTVLGGEHFAAVIGAVYCAAAPVRDARGEVCAVLDLSSEGLPFAFDATALVQLSATAIENRLLAAQPGTALVLALHLQWHLVDSPLAGWIGVDEAGQVTWANPAAARWLGHPRAWDHAAGLSVESVLGCQPGVLFELARRGGLERLNPPNGLKLWMRSQACATTAWSLARPAMGHRLAPPPCVPQATADLAASTLRPEGSPAVGGANAAAALFVPASAPIGTGAPNGAEEPVTPGLERAGSAEPRVRQADDWRSHEQALLAETLAQCGGNVSEAARRLKVSRGLIYRRLAAISAQTSP